MDSEDLYDGFPVTELPITDVDVPDPTHLRRSLRYQGEVDIDPAAAIEAALDAGGLVARDPQSRTGEAIRVVWILAEGQAVISGRPATDGASAGWSVARSDRVAGWALVAGHVCRCGR